MKSYEIVIEDTRTVLRCKTIKARSMAAAIREAEEQEWTAKNGWEEWDSHSSCEIRNDQCRELKDLEE